MAKRGWKAALALALGALASPALAQSAAPAASHVYVGGTVGGSRFSPSCTGCESLDTALRVFGGYQVNRIFAGEIGFANLGQIRGSGVQVDGNSWDASLVAGWPAMGPVSVFGRVGIFRANLKGGGTLAGRQHDNYGLTYGAGAQLELTPNIALRLDWQEYSGTGGAGIPDMDVRLLSAGALWRFR